MTPSLAQYVLTLCDRGLTPAAIQGEMPGVPMGEVYAILRQQRPDRARAPRPRTSDVPAAVLQLRAGGIRVGCIATLLGVSRAYVHRIIAEAEFR